MIGEGLDERVGVNGWGKAFPAKTLDTAGTRGNVEDPGGMVEDTEDRDDAIGGKADVNGGMLAINGGKALGALAIGSESGRLPGWQNEK